MDESAFVGLFARCSNAGRWGPDDQQGTLNLITAEKRVQAAREVVEGLVVPLGLPLISTGGPAPSFTHRMIDLGHGDSWASLDAVEIAPHGFDVTHMDAIGHVLFEGRMYNGRRSETSILDDGLAFASIDALASGIFTRGVLLDVAAAKGVPYLPFGSAVGADDLLEAERYGHAVVQEGDAMVVRTGMRPLEAAEGDSMARGGRSGLAPDCVPWIHERGVAVYAGDCIEQLPSPYGSVASPLHQVGLASMGLVMLDNPDVERLSEVCQRLGRWTFLLTCAPLVIRGGSGSAVNPLAVF